VLRTGGTASSGNSNRRRRGGHRPHDKGPEASVSPPQVSPPTAAAVAPSPNEYHDLQQQGDLPRPRQPPNPKQSPRLQPVPPSGDPAPKEDRGKRPGKNAKLSPSMEALDSATANLSLLDGGGGRRFRRNRSNMSKKSNKEISPQRGKRTSSEDPGTSPPQRLSLGSRPDNVPETGKRGGYTVNIPTSAPHEALRLPDLAPGSNDSRDTANLIRSEDTDFGSDISRGVVKEGRLYNYRPHERLVKTKDVKPDVKVSEERVEPQTRGVLRIQPRPPEPKSEKQSGAGHRGGLLFIHTNAHKPNATTVPAPKPVKPVRPPNPSLEFNRNAVPLRKDPEPPARPDREAVSPRIPTHPISLHSGPDLVLTTEDIDREVNLTYREILNLEGKVKANYASGDEMLETTRLARRSTHDAVLWTNYCNLHRE
jgi:hypothetical protein